LCGRLSLCECSRAHNQGSTLEISCCSEGFLVVCVISQDVTQMELDERSNAQTNLHL
jgi:hypothetical protein